MKKKLLILTYRYTVPPLGGAEVYLNEMINLFDKSDVFETTISYLDSYNIENQYHFSIKASRNTQTLVDEFRNTKFKKFKYIELKDEKKLKNSRLLMKNWTDEFLLSARKFISIYNETLILGGFNFVEKNGTSFQLWTSSISELYLNNVNNITIEGFSPSNKKIDFLLNNEIVNSKVVDSWFFITFPILNNGILTIKCKDENIGDDIRPLGILINKITCDNKILDLSLSYKEFLKENYLSDYIDELIITASNRNQEIDKIFQKTRGFNSLELEEYLDKNTKNFDFILGHSIPFATSVVTSKYALKNNKPYALLPHFHFDDEFYHWNSYYEALKNANIVFASPSISIPKFYNKLDINAIEVPGGGINKNEYSNIDNDLIFNLIPSSKPYFFFLGRKSGAKKYLDIIEAIEYINRFEHICNFVMIGRDEDNELIKSKYTYYLGEQSREVVLSALNNSISLVNMSESESFGIVVIEAWMLKKMVIINQNCPAFVELVDDKINGLYADKNNLREILKFTIENKEFINKLGLQGYENSKRYEWSDISKLIINEIKKEIIKKE